jgi:Zn-dependent alcohol dehydrogenase
MMYKLSAIAILLSLSTGCAMSNSSPVTGGLYTGAKGATGATSNPLGPKSGQSCASSILGVVGIGDASIASAAKAGGISKVAAVDSDNFSILGIYAKNCTVVTGE